MKKAILFLGITVLFFNNIVFSQNTYELLFSGEKSSIIYGGILGLENGTAFIPIGMADANFQFPNTVEHYMYKISPEGDTTRWDFMKEDTLISTTEIIYDTLNTLIAHGLGFAVPLGELEDRFFWIASITTNFEINWFKTYHFAPEEYNHTVSSRLLKLKSNEYVYSGITEKNSPNDWVRHIFRFNRDGDSLQLKLIPHIAAGLNIQSLTYSPDSSDLLAHLDRFVSSNTSPANGDRIDIESFDSLSSFSYPRHNSTPIYYFSPPYSAITYPNNTIIAAGDYYYKENNNVISYHVIGAFKYDNDFNILNEQHLAVSDPDIVVRTTTYNGIDYYDPNQIYVSGIFGYYGWDLFETDNWVYLAKLDENFDLVWEKYLGGDAYYRNESMEATSDGGVVLAGYRYDENINNPNESDAYVWKLNSDGMVNIKEESSLQLKSAILYPNPSTNGKVFLRTALKNTIFVLYTAQGKEVLTQAADSKITTIKISHLPKGEYIWKLQEKSEIKETGKLIIP